MLARAVAFWRSSPGKKSVMAVTGLVMLGFLVLHVAANLLVYLGPRWINGYGALLHATGPLLWVARAGLLVALVLHVVVAAQLALRARRARPTPYVRLRTQAATPAERTIRWTGVVLLAFVVFHTLQMTLGIAHPRFVHLDDYANVVHLFRWVWMVPLYLAALVALALHLYHGAWSSVRTLGFAPSSPTPLRRPIALALAVGLAAALATIPLAVRAGWVGDEPPAPRSRAVAETPEIRSRHEQGARPMRPPDSSRPAERPDRAAALPGPGRPVAHRSD